MDTELPQNQDLVVKEKRGRGRPKKYNTEEEKLTAKRAQWREASQRYYEHHKQGN